MFIVIWSNYNIDNTCCEYDDNMFTLSRNEILLYDIKDFRIQHLKWQVLLIEIAHL